MNIRCVDLSAEAETRAPEQPAVPDFDLVRRLGGGGFGDVWLALSRTGVFRALKLVPKGLVCEIELEGIRTFERYASSHPNLIDIRHVGSIETHLYYVMELADADSASPIFFPDQYAPRTLASDLTRHGAFTLRELLPSIRPVLEALEYLHGRKLLHRDVKPANVVFIGGTPKLADVGLMRDTEQRCFEGATAMYAPPEGVIDPSGDLYCFGKMLYEMLTGMSPAFWPEGPDERNTRRELRRVLPVLVRACADDPARRFHSARELARALERVVTQSGALRETINRVAAISCGGLLAATIGFAAAYAWTRHAAPGANAMIEIPPLVVVVDRAECSAPDLAANAAEIELGPR